VRAELGFLREDIRRFAVVLGSSTRQRRRAVPGTDPEFLASLQRIILRRAAESGAGQHFPSDQVFGHYAILIQDKLDALVCPTQTRPIQKIGEAPKRNSRGLFGNFGHGITSLMGWPELTIPAGFTSEGLPVGISFVGPEFSDMKLLAFGYA
jgi:amidase